MKKMIPLRFFQYIMPSLCAHATVNNFHTYLMFLQEHILSFHNVVLRYDTLDGYISIMFRISLENMNCIFTAVELPVAEHVI